jgi:vanillate/3-O-methylgallate O-demethylase
MAVGGRCPALENEYAEPGTEVTVVSGEQPVSTRPAVQEHRQVEIRAIVAPGPFVDCARETYRGR